MLPDGSHLPIPYPRQRIAPSYMHHQSHEENQPGECSGEYSGEHGRKYDYYYHADYQFSGGALRGLVGNRVTTRRRHGASGVVGGKAVSPRRGSVAAMAPTAKWTGGHNFKVSGQRAWRGTSDRFVYSTWYR